VVALLAAGSVGLAGSKASPTKQGRPGSGASIWARHLDDSGVWISIPASWSYNAEPVPSLRSPVMLFAAGTDPIPTGGSCAPSAAIEQLSPDGAILALQEYDDVDQPYQFPPRPEHFDLGPLFGPFACWNTRAHDIEFRDGDRFFQVTVVFGREATPSLQDIVVQSLDSLAVVPRGGSNRLADACARGAWTACPDAVWAYRAMVDAGIEHLGQVGDRAIVAFADGRSFSIWTAHGTPPSSQRCRMVHRSKVCPLGSRLAWRTQGIVVWLEPAESPFASLSTTAALPGDSALERLVHATEELARSA
jgi:hypothetical protein